MPRVNKLNCGYIGGEVRSDEVLVCGGVRCVQLLHTVGIDGGATGHLHDEAPNILLEMLLHQRGPISMPASC